MLCVIHLLKGHAVQVGQRITLLCNGVVNRILLQNVQETVPLAAQRHTYGVIICGRLL